MQDDQQSYYKIRKKSDIEPSEDPNGNPLSIIVAVMILIGEAFAVWSVGHIVLLW